MTINFKNWKTTLGAVVAIVIQFGPLVFPKYINETTANTISLIAASLGLIQAKDHNVTGGTVVNSPNEPAAVTEAATEEKPAEPVKETKQ